MVDKFYINLNFIIFFLLKYNFKNFFKTYWTYIYLIIWWRHNLFFFNFKIFIKKYYLYFFIKLNFLYNLRLSLKKDLYFNYSNVDDSINDDIDDSFKLYLGFYNFLYIN